MKVYTPFWIVPHFFLFPPLLPLHSLLPVPLLFDTVVIFDSDWNPHQVGEQEGQLCHVINYYFIIGYYIITSYVLNNEVVATCVANTV